MNGKTAEQIYDDAVRRAREDHNAMIADFIADRIDIAAPCGMDRERQYVIDAFKAVIGG